MSSDKTRYVLSENNASQFVNQIYSNALWTYRSKIFKVLIFT